MLTIGSIVWGVRDYRAALEFWTAALDYRPKRDPDDDWALLVPKSGDGVQLAIQLVTSDAETHQRHHLDLYAMDQAAQVERLLGLGATRVNWRYPPDADYVVLADPDGNTFCVIDASDDGDDGSSHYPDDDRDHDNSQGNEVPRRDLVIGHGNDRGEPMTTSTATIPAADAFAYRGARALVILHEQEMRNFLPVWRQAKVRKLQLPETSDSDYGSLEHLLTHVLRASGRYLAWTCKVLELPDPGVPAAPPVEEIADRADDYLEAVLAAWREPLRGVPESRFEDRTYTSNWGAQLNVESMLEHAVMHPIR